MSIGATPENCTWSLCTTPREMPAATPASIALPPASRTACAACVARYCPADAMKRWPMISGCMRIDGSSRSRVRASVRCRAGLPHEVGPTLHFVRCEGGELLRRAGRRLSAKHLEALPHVGLLEDLRDLVADLGDDFLWRAARHPDAIPGLHIVA